MNKFWNGGENILGSGEGRVQHRGPGEGLPKSLESICERGEDSGCTLEKLLVEVDHPQKLLESRFVRRWRKGGDGGGVLGQRRTTGGGEKVPKKLNLGDCKIALGQPDCLIPTEDKNLLEVVNMRRKILAEDKNIGHINKTEQ